MGTGGALGETDGSSLDTLARELAAGEISRRTALRRFAGASLTAAIPGFLLTSEADAACPETRQCGSKCCPKGARCKNGRCKCRNGKKKCGNKCVDIRIDPANCGACKHTCAAAETCVEGACIAPVDPQPACGNNVAEGAEQCDGIDLRGATCASLGLGTGTLSCGSNCTYLTSGCTASPVCGNGVVEAGEQCDGSNLDGQTCVDRGYISGTLVCGPNCSFDESGCVAPCSSAADCPGDPNDFCVQPVCNAGVCGLAPLSAIDDEVACTVDSCNPNTGFISHTPQNSACAPGQVCDPLSGCVPEVVNCGNGITEGSETCDDGDTSSGDGCSAICQIEPGFTCTGNNPSVCTTFCGDGVIAGQEICDGANLNGHTCQTQGFSGGALACSPNCMTFDTSSCV